MKLRPETILFIDDIPTNLAEIKFAVPGINVAGLEFISSMLSDFHFMGKDDTSHSRLKQYKVLEEKLLDEIKYKSNEEFF